MRYFSELAYNGTHYHGWQRQPNAHSVQEEVERAFSTILGADIEVVGCGRTDTGVHASQYFMHFDFEGKFPEGFVKRVNKLLPADISIRQIFEVKEDAHARFDAVRRSYEYHIVFEKNPFEGQTAWHFPFFEKLDFEKLHQAATLLLSYHEFFPFCKTHTDAKTMKVALTRSEWVVDRENQRMTYHISADRFLRGMVRLVVGMCLNVGLGKVALDEVVDALDKQVLLRKSWSVPPQGLFLTEVKYE
ncbi:MAG: tRNA pseudouridine(38-40) synthase TruA [Lewinellaceae bacterium]|nr:tRNA pseudouridine(38-40) synthase TruA [Saprospiraceae bacterium]MCB9338122.1 tRNA pseudouridine(38-40) synthase TruA [Lewinellaceae bacterium]